MAATDLRCGENCYTWSLKNFVHSVYNGDKFSQIS